MLNASIRRSGGSLNSIIPSDLAEHSRLDAGSSVAVKLSGPELTLRALRKRPSMEALLAQTPRGGRQRAENWDAMAPAGREL